MYVVNQFSAVYVGLIISKVLFFVSLFSVYLCHKSTVELESTFKVHSWVWDNFRLMKMVKLFFISCSKLFSLLRYLHLCWLFGYVEKRLDKMVKLNSKICDVKDCKRIITIHIFPNISRSKDNQAMRFGRLVEYNMFFKNHAEKGAGTLISDLFLLFKKVL